MPTLPYGLAAIIHRCLEPNPWCRYQTADALAAELQRFLNGGWIIRTHLVMKLLGVIRHVRRQLWFYVTLFLLGAAVGVSNAWFESERRLNEELRQERDAAARERDAKAAAVRDLIEQAEAIAPLNKGNVAGRPVFDRALHYLSEMAAAAEQDPNRAGEAADLYRRVGKLMFGLGNVPKAAGNYDTALRLSELALKADDVPANRHRLAMILRERGVTRSAQAPVLLRQIIDKDGMVTAAKADWDRALQLLELLEPLAPAGAEYRFTLAQLHMVRANVAALEKGRQEAASEEYGVAKRLIDGLLGEAPNNRSYRFTLAEILNNRALLVGNNAAKWEPDCRRAVEIRLDLVAEEPDRPEQKAFLAASLNNHGMTLQAQGPSRFDEAEKVYKEAQEIYKALILAFPGVKSNREELDRHVEANLRRLAASRDKLAPPPRPK